MDTQVYLLVSIFLLLYGAKHLTDSERSEEEVAAQVITSKRSEGEVALLAFYTLCSFIAYVIMNTMCI